MSADDSSKWDRIHGGSASGAPEPARVLAEHTYLLPETGAALDLACGRGGNALLLAGLGLETHAWDISAVALNRLREQARQQGLPVHTRECDLTRVHPGENRFDVIVVSRYLDRELAPRLVRALRQDGLLFYQTFVSEKPSGVGPGNPDYLLGENELLHLFSGLHLLFYQEEGLVGDTAYGVRNEALLIAQKR